LDSHAVSRPQIGNHETASGIDDYGVVPADIVVRIANQIATKVRSGRLTAANNSYRRCHRPARLVSESKPA
jgi:hypothetical protein